MPADMNLNNIDIGDWVHVPDTLYPWNAPNSGYNRGSDIYGSVCRSAVVTRAYTDGVVSIMFSDMRDYSHLEGGERTFTYEPNIYANELVLIMTGDEYRERNTDSVPDAPYDRDVQPRDAAGRFTSHTTTIRPGIFNIEYSSVGYASVR